MLIVSRQKLSTLSESLELSTDKVPIKQVPTFKSSPCWLETSTVREPSAHEKKKKKKHLGPVQTPNFSWAEPIELLVHEKFGVFA